MLEQISELVRQYGSDAVINNPEIPNEANNEILAETAQTITGGLQNMLAGGGFGDIFSMFAGKDGKQGGIGGMLKNPIVVMMVGHLISKLVKKFNLSPAQASNISNSLIPNVLNGLVSKTISQDPENDAFDFNDLIGSLTGGNVSTSESLKGGFNFQDLLDQFTGGGGTGNGINLEEIVTQVTQGARQGQGQLAGSSGGGLVDLVRGIFR